MSRHFRAGSRASEVYRWLRANPGLHAPQDVASHLHITTHQAAVTLSNLLSRSLVVREDSRYGVAERRRRVDRPADWDMAAAIEVPDEFGRGA